MNNTKSGLQKTFELTPQEKYLNYHIQLCDKCRKLSKRKQSDYCSLNDTSDDLSVVANFMLPEQLGIITTEQSIMSRIADKFNRLITVVNNDKCNVEDENEYDTMMDMINFIILLSYYRKLSKTKENVDNAK